MPPALAGGYPWGMSLADLLRSTATLRRQTSTKDTTGPGASVTYADVPGQTAVPCDVQPAGASVRQHFGQSSLVVSHHVYLAADIGAHATDILVVNGRTFQVVEGSYEPGASGYDEWPAVLHCCETPFGP